MGVCIFFLDTVIKQLKVLFPWIKLNSRGDVRITLHRAVGEIHKNRVRKRWKRCSKSVRRSTRVREGIRLERRDRVIEALREKVLGWRDLSWVRKQDGRIRDAVEVGEGDRASMLSQKMTEGFQFVCWGKRWIRSCCTCGAPAKQRHRRFAVSI